MLGWLKVCSSRVGSRFIQNLLGIGLGLFSVIYGIFMANLGLFRVCLGFISSL